MNLDTTEEWKGSCIPTVFAEVGDLGSTVLIGEDEAENSTEGNSAMDARRRRKQHFLVPQHQLESSCIKNSQMIRRGGPCSVGSSHLW